MKQEDLNVFIPYNFAVNSSTSGFDIFLYSFLRYLTMGGLLGTYYVHPESLAMMIFGNTKKTKEINNSLQKLPVGLKFGNVYKICNDDFVIDGGYVAIKFNCLQKILLEGGSSWSKLVKLAVLIQAKARRDLRTKHNSYYVTDTPQTLFASMMNLKNGLSIQKYIQRLEKIKVIYVRRSALPHVNNLMGLYENKDLIDSYAHTLKFFNANQERVNASNNKRSLMQKYNQICKGKKYDAETVAQVRAYIEEYNAEQRKLAKQHPEDDYLSNIKDITVLDKVSM